MISEILNINKRSARFLNFNNCLFLDGILLMLYEIDRANITIE